GGGAKEVATGTEPGEKVAERARWGGSRGVGPAGTGAASSRTGTSRAAASRDERPHTGHRGDWSPDLSGRGARRPRVVDPLAADEGELLRADDTHDVVPAHRPPSAAQEGEIPDAVLDLADRMLRLPRHLGIHSARMVMCHPPGIEACPVALARLECRTVLQWDKEDCADAGLVKFDLLGLGMLTALRIGFDLVERHEGGPRLALHMLPEDDPAVYDLLCAADTVGVFQVESRAQMA